MLGDNHLSKEIETGNIIKEYFCPKYLKFLLDSGPITHFTENLIILMHDAGFEDGGLTLIDQPVQSGFLTLLFSKPDCYMVTWLYFSSQLKHMKPESYTLIKRQNKQTNLLKVPDTKTLNSETGEQSNFTCSNSWKFQLWLAVVNHRADDIMPIHLTFIECL